MNDFVTKLPLAMQFYLIALIYRNSRMSCCSLASLVQIAHDRLYRVLYLSFAFFSGTEVAESMIMYGHGYIKLRECRHTYWGDEGYIYFPSKIQFIKIFDWLEAQGFDLD